MNRVAEEGESRAIDSATGFHHRQNDGHVLAAGLLFGAEAELSKDYYVRIRFRLPMIGRVDSGIFGNRQASCIGVGIVPYERSLPKLLAGLFF